MQTKDRTQKDIDILIDLVSKSGLTARQKELALDKIKRIVAYVDSMEIENNKIKAQRHGFNYTNFINHTDRLYAFCDILGVNEIDIELLKPEWYEFIRANYHQIKQPISHVTFQQIVHALKLYFSFNESYPASMLDLKKWLDQNDYTEMILELKKETEMKIREVNHEI